MNELRIRLRQLHQQLSQFGPYNMLRTPRILTLVALLLGLGFLLGTSHGGGFYNISAVEHISTTHSEIESTMNTTQVDGYLEQRKKDNQLLHDPSHPKTQQRFIFIDHSRPISMGYQYILNGMTPEEFANKPLEDKCAYYFSTLYSKDPEWSLNTLEGFSYDGGIFDGRDRFLNERRGEYHESIKKQRNITGDAVDEFIKQHHLEAEWELQYQTAVKESRETEVYMADQMTNLRVFSQCYLNDEILPSVQDRIESNITCATHEKRLLKFLTKEFPIYRRWNDEHLTMPPIIDDYLADENHVSLGDERLHQLTGCFSRDLRDTYNGKGIVISAFDNHEAELSSLLLVLRAIKNKLPIQIVHRGDLSFEVQNRLTNVARSENLNLDKMNLFRKLVQKDFEHVNDVTLDKVFPKQEIWYVNATNTIVPGDKRFWSYGNKLVALLFSSFEHTVLIDTDTVPFVDIDSYILGSEVYQDLGAFFFKDRELNIRESDEEITYFRKLLPTGLDTAFFNIPELTEHTYGNRFFGLKFKHYQESGMVAIDKKRHMRSILTINALQMWDAVTAKVHGDKELFWLGFSIAGDEDYYMNKYGTAAVGTLNPNSNRLIDDETDTRRSALKSHMICTTHPAHLSGVDDKTLLWMNSGFVTCKRPDEAIDDIKKDLYRKIFKDADELREKYVGPLKINALIVPPPQEYKIMGEIESGEPAVGWDVMNGCGGYLFCAYDHVGNSTNPKHHGTLIEFDDDQTEFFDYLGELWVYSDKIIGNT